MCIIKYHVELFLLSKKIKLKWHIFGSRLGPGPGFGTSSVTDSYLLPYIRGGAGPVYTPIWVLTLVAPWNHSKPDLVSSPGERGISPNEYVHIFLVNCCWKQGM